MSSPRVRRVADRIQVTVAEMLERRIKDPRLGFVTVTDVRVSGDTQHATVFYTVFGDEGARTSSAAALESARGLIRAEVGKALGIRHVPSLEFIHDALPDEARHLEELLATARESDAAVAAASAGARHAGDADPYKKPHEEDLGDGDLNDRDPDAAAPDHPPTGDPATGDPATGDPAAGVPASEASASEDAGR